MDIFDVLQLIGGLALFLFGMKVMGDALEKKAGGRMSSVLGKMTDGKLKGFGLGMGVTSVIQSSSATTVMVVGFVNSGIMTLKQAINIIMGANVGTTVTAWILSLTGIQGDNLFIRLLKPSSFMPVLAIIGIALILLSKKQKRRDTGTILLGFAVLMTGMEAMSSAVSGLRDVPQFTSILTLFANPIFGVLAGAVLTAIIQSSSASVGILQALSSTGTIAYSSAIPIIMGQNIGTCVTALIASVGANKNAKRAAMAHLYFNIIGTVVLMSLFYGINAFVKFSFVDMAANEAGIAIVHTMFNVLSTALLLPFSGLLEKLARLSVRDSDEKEHFEILDKRFLDTPSVALERAFKATCEMATFVHLALISSLSLVSEFDEEKAKSVFKAEEMADDFEDNLGTYLVKLSSKNLSVNDSAFAAVLLRVIGDIERISDHSVNITEAARELNAKELSFSTKAEEELQMMMYAVEEIMEITSNAFENKSALKAREIEPLEQVIDDLEAEIRKRHVQRLQSGECTIKQGFVLQDILTDLERIADHCSNIAGYVIELDEGEFEPHKLTRLYGKENEEFLQRYREYEGRYKLKA